MAFLNSPHELRWLDKKESHYLQLQSSVISAKLVVQIVNCLCHVFICTRPYSRAHKKTLKFECILVVYNLNPNEQQRNLCLCQGFLLVHISGRADFSLIAIPEQHLARQKYTLDQCGLAYFLRELSAKI